MRPSFLKKDVTLKKLEKLFKKKKYDEAFDKASILQESFPKDSLINLLLAYLFVKQGRPQLSVSHLESILQVDPNHQAALMFSAYTDLLAGREKQAIMKYTRLLKSAFYVKKVEWILTNLKKSSLPILIKKYSFESFFSLPKNLFEDLNTGKKKKQKKSNFLKLKWVLLLILLLFLLSTMFYFYTLIKENKITNFNFDDFLKNFTFKNTDKEFFLKTTEKTAVFSKTNATQGHTAEEIFIYYKKMKHFVQTRQDNQAIMLYNQIRASEISFIYKERFYMLKKLIPNPNFSEFKNNLGVSFLLTNQHCLDVYIKWQGFFSKQKTKEELWLFSIFEEGAVTYTALVDFDDKDFLVKEKQAYFLLGQNKGIDKKRNQLLLKGLAVKEINPLL